MAEDEELRPDSLLPYDDWTDEAYRQIVLRALSHVAQHGLPGEHHFYLTFRTDHPGTVIPARLRAQYPEVMTIVLQHQFWELAVDEATKVITVGLSFSGVPATLTIPLGAVTAFADPHVRWGLQFRVLRIPRRPRARARPADRRRRLRSPKSPPSRRSSASMHSVAARRRKP